MCISSVSKICAKATTHNNRKQNLVEIRENILAISHLNTINQGGVDNGFNRNLIVHQFNVSIIGEGNVVDS